MAVQRLVGSARSTEDAVERLYLTALTRRPTTTERELIGDFLKRRQYATPAQAYAAVLWTLINTAEFNSIH